MISDYYVSSQDKDDSWEENNCSRSSSLYANTTRDGETKQYLDEHIVKVSRQTAKVAQCLPKFKRQMNVARDISFLKKKSL